MGMVGRFGLIIAIHGRECHTCGQVIIHIHIKSHSTAPAAQRVASLGARSIQLAAVALGIHPRIEQWEIMLHGRIHAHAGSAVANRLQLALHIPHQSSTQSCRTGTCCRGQYLVCRASIAFRRQNIQRLGQLA